MDLGGRHVDTLDGRASAGGRSAGPARAAARRTRERRRTRSADHPPVGRGRRSGRADRQLHLAGVVDVDLWRRHRVGLHECVRRQGGVVLTENERWLIVVNAASDDVTVFAVESSGLRHAGTTPSGGRMPISVAVHGSLVYVLNAGGAVGEADNITGFVLEGGGLTPLAGSTRPLTSSATAPAEVAFRPDGRVLVVTEKTTNTIDTYTVGSDGLASGPNLFPSAHPTPFGFAFGKRDQVFVSEAGGGADASAVSSYLVADDGSLEVITPAAATTETAACWVVVTPDGRFAYTTNTGSGSMPGHRVALSGELALLDGDGRTGVTGAGSSPIDMALSRDGRFLYTLNSGSGTIAAFSSVRANGSLSPLRSLSGLPAGSNGLAAR